MKNKEPSLLRQIIAIHHEQALRRKAMRTLAKQEWSIEFLTELLRRAADMKKDNLLLEIRTKGGNVLTITSIKASDHLNDSDDIFNHLDDEAAIQQFIYNNNRRR